MLVLFVHTTRVNKEVIMAATWRHTDDAHTYTHTHLRAHTHTHTHTCAQTLSFFLFLSLSLSHTDTHIHTHTRKHTHTHAQSQEPGTTSQKNSRSWWARMDWQQEQTWSCPLFSRTRAASKLRRRCACGLAASVRAAVSVPRGTAL